MDFIEEYAGARWGPPLSISDDVQLRSPSVAPSLRAQLRAEIGRALRGDACGPELQPEFEPVVKPKGSDCRRPVISGPGIGTSAKIETETGLFSLMLKKVLPG